MSSHFSINSNDENGKFYGIRTEMYIYKDQFAHFVYLVLWLVLTHNRTYIYYIAHDILLRTRASETSKRVSFIAFVHG